MDTADSPPGKGTDARPQGLWPVSLPLKRHGHISGIAALEEDYGPHEITARTSRPGTIYYPRNGSFVYIVEPPGE